MRTIHRGGDLKTISRQHGGFLGLLKMLGLGEVQKEMSDPISKQHVMQRGGFPWALTGLSLLPALLGKGDDTIRSQMSISRDPVMLRGGLSVLPAITKSLPLVKDIAAPLALGALASLGDVMFGVPETGLLKCTLRRPEQEGGKESKTARDIRRRADI